MPNFPKASETGASIAVLVLVCLAAFLVVRDCGQATTLPRTPIAFNEPVQSPSPRINQKRHESPPTAQSQLPVPESGTSIGNVEVMDASGQSIEGARVIWMLESERTPDLIPTRLLSKRVTRTDSHGLAIVNVPTSARIYVQVEHARFQSAEFERIVAASDDSWTARVVLNDGAWIRGRVVARGGGGVGDAIVLAASSGFRRRSLAEMGADPVWRLGTQAARTTTDRDGNFLFSCLVTGAYSLEVAIPGMVREDQTFRSVIARTGDTVEIIVTPVGLVYFDLVDDQCGAPILDIARVQLEPADEPDHLFVAARMVTHGDWWFGDQVIGPWSRSDGHQPYIFLVDVSEWPIPKGGAAKVRVKVDGYHELVASVPIQVPWSGSAIECTEVRLKRAVGIGTIRFHCVSRVETPLSKIRARVILGDGDPVLHGITLLTDDAGNCDRIVPVGNYTIVPDEISGKMWEETRVRVTDGRMTDCDLVLSAAAVKLRLVDEFGNPLDPLSEIVCATAPGYAPIPQGTGPRAPGRRHALKRDSALDNCAIMLFAEPGPRVCEFFAPGYDPCIIQSDVRGGTVTELIVRMHSNPNADWLPPVR